MERAALDVKRVVSYTFMLVYNLVFYRINARQSNTIMVFGFACVVVATSYRLYMIGRLAIRMMIPGPIMGPAKKIVWQLLFTEALVIFGYGLYESNKMYLWPLTILNSFSIVMAMFDLNRDNWVWPISLVLLINGGIIAVIYFSVNVPVPIPVEHPVPISLFRTYSQLLFKKVEEVKPPSWF